MKPVILITGGCGYIGSHTILELLSQDIYDVVSIDNFSNSSPRALDRIKAISGREVLNYNMDLCDLPALRQVFAAHPHIVGVIHFAALKAVGESVEKPLDYYGNNFLSMINILRCSEETGVKYVIFSSSCSIYGNIEKLPVNEDTPVADPESPYAYTKLAGERILRDAVHASTHVQAISLRYFNPVGGHISGLNGEQPLGRPNNLVPVITQTAAGWIPQMTVYGGDYPTRDGSCIRDYVHVTDLALAHLKAIDYLAAGKNEHRYEAFNLGSGEGVTVLEAIHAFEQYTGQRLNYQVGPRRPGDVVAIYSDCSHARERLGWEPAFGIDVMMATAWKWQELLNHERELA
ncbi:MAG: UDP-glucose 4-epimerase GalE [Bacteroidetes bacterium]|nr:MAG: UDP-glucose 4-epimerase GalE [Bacteroidota bacterium]